MIKTISRVTYVRKNVMDTQKLSTIEPCKQSKASYVDGSMYNLITLSTVNRICFWPMGNLGNRLIFKFQSFLYLFELELLKKTSLYASGVFFGKYINCN